MGSRIDASSILNYRYRGVLAASVIGVAWATTLGIALLAIRGPLPVLLTAPLLVPAISFLYAGLFITAHDAMHGTLAPRDPRLNRFIGRAAVFLYAGFPYRVLYEAHHAHHRHPASSDDPDYHDGRHTGFFAWYFQFMRHYLSIWPLGVMVLYAAFFQYVLHVPLFNLLLFWALPCVLSSIQLFYFGTYLPHRRPPEGYLEPHRARSNDYSELLSLLSCYHFGYHLEHHVYPFVPWWRLPGVRRVMQDG